MSSDQRGLRHGGVRARGSVRLRRKYAPSLAATGVVGVFFAAAVKELGPELPWWQVDLFANVIKAAVDDDPTH